MTHFRSTVRWALAASVIAMLSACGGAGGGGGLNSTPTPVPPPSPTPTPTPTPNSGQPPLPAGPIGLTSGGGFVTEAAGTVVTADAKSGVPTTPGVMSAGADLVAISYNASDQSYTVTVPGFEQGKLIHPSGNGSYMDGSATWQELHSTYSEVTRGNSAEVQNLHIVLAWPASSSFSYTNFADWLSEESDGGQTHYRNGVFAYGTPTAAGDVPISGSASYQGYVLGISENATATDTGGTVLMNFDFAAGSLTGMMNLELSTGWETSVTTSVGFRDTVYASGGTAFSGLFDTAKASSDASFAGRFTGPGAAELMAHFQGSFLFPDFSQPQAISGVWIAKK